MEEEVTLKVEGSTFKVKKRILSDHSDFFRALFSGGFKESAQQEISLEMVDAISMQIILAYLENKNIKETLSKYCFTVVTNLAMAADALNIPDLSNDLQTALQRLDVTADNWFKIMDVANKTNSTKLRESVSSFGLLALRDKIMEPKHVPSIEALVWYLSQSFLYCKYECDVFEFGLKWLSNYNMQTNTDALLMILGCLDIKRSATEDLDAIKKMAEELNNSTILAVLDCLIEVSKATAITIDEIIKHKPMIIDRFTEQIFDETLNLVRSSKCRKIAYTTLIAFGYNNRSDKYGTNFVLQAYTGTRVTNWFVHNHKPGLTSLKYKQCFEWNCATWGPTPTGLVVACTDYSIDCIKQIRNCVTTIYLFDAIKKEMKQHDIITAGYSEDIAVVGDCLFILCSNKLDNIVYNLKDKTYKTIAKPPVLWQEYDFSTCTYNDEVYICIFKFNKVTKSHLLSKFIFKYNNSTDNWIAVARYDINGCIMGIFIEEDYINLVSSDDYDGSTWIYCFTNGVLTEIDEQSDLCKYKICFNSERFTDNQFVCNLVGRILYINYENFWCSDQIGRQAAIFEHKKYWNADGRTWDFDETMEHYAKKSCFVPDILAAGIPAHMMSVRNVCQLAISTPPAEIEISEYLVRCLQRYNSMSS